MTLSPDAQRWIETQCGGRIVAVEQQPRWRPQYFVQLDRGGERLDILARGGRGDAAAKSRLLSRYNLAHEAQVLQALQGHGLRVPIFYGFSNDHQLILLERLRGTNTLADAPDDETRRRVLFEYYDQLAALHRLDVRSMQVGAIEIPKTQDEIAFAGKFRYAEDEYRAVRPTMRPEPLMDLALWWLHANVPRNGREATFIQGDTGPGQFMFADGRLTGMIDWELSHIGDPMLDLGVARMRNMLYPAGSLREPIRHYEEVSGRPVDWPALGFYTVMSMTFTPLGVAQSLQQPSATLPDLLPRYEWDVTLRRGLCDALAEVEGIDVALPELPPPAEGPPGMADLLVEHLEVNCLKVAQNPVDRHQIKRAIALARGQQLASRVGAALLSDDLDDMHTVLGRRPADREEGMTALSRMVDDGPGEHLAELVRLFTRLERRREFLWKPMMMDSASTPFEPLSPNRSKPSA
jgi:aminoglycoside phosphotransferase (APT) family kinase protein